MKGSMFMTQGNPPPHHPMAQLTAKYCIQQIEECGGKNVFHGGSKLSYHHLNIYQFSIRLI